MKKITAWVLAVIMTVCLTGCVSQQDYDTMLSENESLSKTVTDLQNERDSLKKELDEVKETILIPQLKEDAAPIVAAINGIGDVSLDKESAINNVQAQYDGMDEKAKQYVTNYDTLKSAQDKIVELRANQSEADKIKEYKNSCQSYGYTEIARDPDAYKGKNAKFTAKIIQVQEGSGLTVLRANVTQGKYSWDDTIYITYYPKTGEKRLLEDDIVTIYGELNGIKTYTTVMGASISIPEITAKYIDVN